MSTPLQPESDQKETTRLKINSSRLLAGTLAAVTGAALSSRLGVAGTLVGTAVISLVSGTASTVYEHSVERGKAAMRSRISALEENGALDRIRPVRRAAADRTAALPADQTVKLPSGSAESGSSTPSTLPEPAGPGRFRTALGALVHSPRRRWALAGAGALATFVLALGIVTMVELAHGSSLSGTGHQTTLGQAFGQSRHTTPQRQPTAPPGTRSSSPTGTPSPTSAPSSNPAHSPSSSPSGSQPSTGSSATSSPPSSTPSQSSPAPSQTPSTAPTATPPADTGTSQPPESNAPSSESSR